MSATRVKMHGTLSWSWFSGVLVGLFAVVETVAFLSPSKKSIAHYRQQTHPSHWLPICSRRSSCLESSAKASENVAQTLTKLDVDDVSVRTLDRSSVSFVEPHTGCEVVLVGCFHGSPSSAQDVKAILSQKLPDVLVLELCPERFRSIQEQVNEAHANSMQKLQNKSRYNRRQSAYSDSALRGVEGLLRLVSRAQSTFFTGLQPGLEFTTAVLCCPDTDIILADQPEQQTLWKLSRLPQNALNMWIDSSPMEETAALCTALFGSSNTNASVNIWDFGTRHWAAQKELVQWILVPLAVCAVMVLVLSSFGGGGGDTGSLPSAVDHVDPLVLSSSALLLASDISVVLLCYLGLILPTTRVILRERDDFLAQGIRAACQVARGNGEPGRVTAILGFLHVNGVTQRLLSAKDESLPAM